MLAGVPKKWLSFPLLLIAILLWSVVLTLPDDKLHVSFLDVGEGDAILIQHKGQNILIDGGPDAQKVVTKLSKKLPFWERTIDLMISTQPRAEYISGLTEVLSRYEVKRVLEPAIPYHSSIYSEWLKLVIDKQIDHNIARAGQEIDLGMGIKMELLNPPLKHFNGTSDDVDNNGVVLRLSWGKVSFLFTSGIRREAELELIRERANIRTTVLKVARHGSKTSTSPRFLATVNPELAVISVGANNKFDYPSPEVVASLVDKLGKDKIYRTDKNGAIEFITDGDRLWVKTER